MDSLFSLFDPSDGGQNKQSYKKRNRNEQDCVKKKTDAPKGRRRGRKSNGKNETLPEESSFLCEPDLSTEMLVKDVSYIENFIEVKRDEDTNTDVDKKPKRRNSGRKSRRKKKVSPAKDTPIVAWSESTETLNNTISITKNTDDNIGKNVNDLTDDYKNNKWRSEEKLIDKKPVILDKDTEVLNENTVHNVIDKFEKVGLKDDMYLAGDFDTDELDNEYYSSDDVEDYIDDSTSDPDDSGDEVRGCLPPEPRFGNVEYKLQLVSLCEKRFQHLVTQLKWRLGWGNGSAVYVIGVRDCGALVGLRARALRASLRTLRRMASALRASLGAVTARRVAPARAVAEVHIRGLADPQQSVELRVAVMGANEAGKSTLIGVLTQGELDNGRGSARLNMFRHLHEVKSGRTSSLSHEILGFDAQGNVVNYGCSELMTAERIGERSAKLVSFLDLAGHSKYQRTTLHGLTGYCPHSAMLVVSATAGVSPITEEHLALLLALELRFCVVLTRCEPAPPAALRARLADLLARANKKPVLITDENMARNCVVTEPLILDAIDGEKEEVQTDQMSQVPVFPVSCVRGNGLNALHAYLLALQPEGAPHELEGRPEDETCEFQIDEVFHIGDSSGPVVGGLMVRGLMREGDEMIIGPYENGEFKPTTISSIHRNRVCCAAVSAGQSASVRSHPAPAPRPGMVILTRRAQNPDPDDITSLASKNLKNVRRKNPNLLDDEECEKGVKNYDEPSSVDRPMDELLLEDPFNPRGCIYFQATVHLLRHSTAIHPGFQCTVLVGNVQQTAIIEGILSLHSVLRPSESASVVFRFVRCPEYLQPGRRLLFTAGRGTRAIGRITQTFPYVP